MENTFHILLSRVIFPPIIILKGVKWKKCRHRALESGLQKAVKLAAKRAGIDKRVTCHTLRHSFATTMLENGVNILVLQNLWGMPM